MYQLMREYKSCLGRWFIRSVCKRCCMTVNMTISNTNTPASCRSLPPRRIPKPVQKSRPTHHPTAGPAPLRGTRPFRVAGPARQCLARLDSRMLVVIPVCFGTLSYLLQRLDGEAPGMGVAHAHAQPPLWRLHPRGPLPVARKRRGEDGGRCGREASGRVTASAVCECGEQGASECKRGSETSGTSGASLSQEDVVVGSLREQHGWADDVLVRDVLRAVDGDEGMASVQLDAMAGPESPEAGGDGEKVGVIGAENRSAGAVECEENDVYLKFRREALRLSRARGKYARGAYNAYMAGNHTHAKQFSREAHENFKNAEKLHAQAAEEILYSRNADGHANVWSIDLHGLHATEAVMALQERLAYLEKELSTNPAFLYSLSQRAPEHEQPLLLAASRAVVKNELSVITGVGRHSRGGPSVPLAVKNFLLAHGYKFSEPRPGAVAVTPKRHYT